MNRLNQKVAVITGGASGIGEATVKLFVEEGARVVITDIQDEKGHRLAEELGPRAKFLHVNVTQEADIKAAIDYAQKTSGRLDCIFNNAGYAGVAGMIEEISVDGFDQTIAVLLRGAFLGMKHAAPIMKRQGTGSIISTASVAGLRTGYGRHIYNAAKAAVIHLTRSVAMELGESGIRVNCICPGAIPTSIFGRGLGLSIEAADKTVESLKSAFIKSQPLPRAGLPEDIARAALWLASDDSSFVNGHALVVDGGLTGGRMWSETLSSFDNLGKVMGIDPDIDKGPII